MKWSLFAYLPMQLLCLGIAAKLVCAVILAWRGLARRYPGLMAFLVLGATQSSYLLWSGFHSPTGYYDAYRATNWIMLALWGVLAVEVFVHVARHFPLTSFTYAWLAILAVGGWGISIALMQPSAWSDLAIAQHLEMAWQVLIPAGAVIAGGFLLFWLLADFRFRRNVRWSVPITLALLACHVVGSERVRRAKIRDRASEVALTGGSFAAACMWAWRLRRDGEEFTLPPADPGAATTALREINGIRREADRLRGASDEAAGD